MIDVVFDLEGISVPEYYPFILWDELGGKLPWLKDEAAAGVVPLRGSVSGGQLLLSRRSKLILRIPAGRAAQAAELGGQVLRIGGNELRVGSSRQRELQPANTLHAWMIATAMHELDFMVEMKRQLQEMEVSCNLICDKLREISDGQRTVRGFGLVLHDLKPAASLRVQQEGLGGAREWGCGIFVPFKAITGLD